MGIFSPDLASVDANIHIFDDKGRYQLLVTKAKPVIKEAKDKTGNVVEKMFVQFNLEMKGRYDEDGKLVTEGFAGRTVTPFKAHLTTEGGWKFSKGFIMAAAGYGKKDEQLANEKLFQAKNWKVSGEADAPSENIKMGDGYEACVDRLVDVTLEKKVQKGEDNVEYENQEFKNWAPVK